MVFSTSSDFFEDIRSVFEENSTNPKPLVILKPSLSMSFNQADIWDSHWVQTRTNCYAYALNCPQVGWARPSQLINQRNHCYNERLITPDNIKNFLLKEGLEEISEYEALSGTFHAVAVKIKDKKDYHFFRHDQADGLWSHKDGGNYPKQHDVDRMIIKNPRKAQVPYPSFVGYFAVPEEGILYRQRLKIPAV
jgi:hypothetical protein